MERWILKYEKSNDVSACNNDIYVTYSNGNGAEISDINREAWEDIGSMADVPTFEMVDNEDGTFSVTAVDCDGNVIFTEEKVSGSVDEIIEDVYKAIYNDYVGEERNAKSPVHIFYVISPKYGEVSIMSSVEIHVQ